MKELSGDAALRLTRTFRAKLSTQKRKEFDEVTDAICSWYAIVLLNGQIQFPQLRARVPVSKLKRRK